MVFSFFKKPPEKMVARPAAAPRPKEKGNQGHVPPEVPAPQPPPAASAPVDAAPRTDAPESGKNDLPPLDFSAFEFSESPHDFHVEAEVDPVDAEAEQAAVLYANGQDDAARALLEDAVHVHRSGPGERLWLMLFDLYRQLGQKSAFEALGIEFARAFEKSPPVWRDGTKPRTLAKVAAVGNLAFRGDLLGSNDAGFLALSQAIEKNPKLRVDFSKVKQIDAAGCGRLMKQMQLVRKAKRDLELLGRDHLGVQLEQCVETGRADNAECWLLILELLQLQGLQEAFDEVAINYAITFEVSPPSWEPKRVAATEPVLENLAEGAEDDAHPSAFTLSGDIKGSRFGDLPAFAEVHDPVVIDCLAVTRMDFVSAGALLNVLTPVRRGGKEIIFRHPSHLVAELFGVIGLKAVSSIVFAKH